MKNPKLNKDQNSVMMAIRRDWRRISDNNPVFSHNRKGFYFLKLWNVSRATASLAQSAAKGYGIDSVVEPISKNSNQYRAGYVCIIRFPFDTKVSIKKPEKITNRQLLIHRLVDPDQNLTIKDFKKFLRLILACIKNTDQYHVYINYPEEPQMGLGSLINRVLRKHYE